MNCAWFQPFIYEERSNRAGSITDGRAGFAVSSCRVNAWIIKVGNSWMAILANDGVWIDERRNEFKLERRRGAIGVRG